MRDFLVDMFLYSSLENMVIYGYFLAVNKIKINFKRDVLLIGLLSFISALGCRIINILLWQFLSIVICVTAYCIFHKAKIFDTAKNVFMGFMLIYGIDTLVLLVLYDILFNIDMASLGMVEKFISSIVPRIIEFIIIGGISMKFIWFSKPAQKKQEQKKKK